MVGQAANLERLKYWFTPLSRAVKTLWELPGNLTVHLEALNDWNKLVAATGCQDVQHAVLELQKLFYPYARNDQVDISSGNTGRRPKFLAKLSDEHYESLYQYLKGNPLGHFPDICKMLKTKKDDVKLMSQVLEHVVLWLNRNPIALYDNTRKNRPLLREDFVPYLEQHMPIVREENGEAFTETSEEASIRLEREVLDFARHRITELEQPGVSKCLEVFPDEHVDEDTVYAERFNWEFWRDLLQHVTKFLGGSFEPWWTSEASSRAPSSLTRHFCSFMTGVPEVASNPALNSTDAIYQLERIIDTAVVGWALSRTEEAIQGQTGNFENHGSADVKSVVVAAAERYRQHLDQVGISAVPSEDNDNQVAQPTPNPTVGQGFQTDTPHSNTGNEGRGLSVGGKPANRPAEHVIIGELGTIHMPAHTWSTVEPGSSQDSLPSISRLIDRADAESSPIVRHTQPSLVPQSLRLSSGSRMAHPSLLGASLADENPISGQFPPFTQVKFASVSTQQEALTEDTDAIIATPRRTAHNDESQHSIIIPNSLEGLHPTPRWASRKPATGTVVV